MTDFQKYLCQLRQEEEVDHRVEQQLASYMEALLEWNKKVNMTSITNVQEFISKHLVDSLTCATSEEFLQAHRILDLGTGGGFPGIPLAALYPDKEFVLLDSLAKRLRIVQELADSLNMKNVTTLHGRAEDLAHQREYREGFDFCVSRAVSNLSTLAELCLPFVDLEGSFVAYKGPDSEEEIRAASVAIERMGGALVRIHTPKIPGFETNHILVFIRKMNRTPVKYPRQAGTPAKSPIK